MSGAGGRDDARALRVGVAVPAAGLGRRMGGRRKPWLELLGEPLLVHALRPFLARPDVTAVRIALGADDAADPPEWLAALDPRVEVVAGGSTRALSVARAVAALPDDVDVVLVHDAARPLVSDAVVGRVVEAASRGVGAVAGLPATDTVKVVDDEGRIVDTPDRDRIWLAQTPQGFPAPMIRQALVRLEADGGLRDRVTDDASVVEAAGGGPVRMVEGDPGNLKVTLPADLPLASFLLRRATGGGAGSRGAEAEGAPFRILYVCTGNTCRSPMAEALTRHLLAERGWEQVEVRSAGVAAAVGAPASAGAAGAASRAGLSLDAHRSTPLSPALVAWADLVLTMSASHLDGVVRMGGGDRAALLTEFVATEADEAGGVRGVPDPFGGDDAVYQATFDALRDMVDRTLDRLAPLVSP